MTKARISGYLALFMLLSLAGCATPAARIRQNPGLFASFPLQIQENVRKGNIEPGYTKDMVFIALGYPYRIYERKSENAVTEIWAYNDFRVHTEFEPFERWYYYRDSRGNVHHMRDMTWMSVSHSDEYESLRVEFEGDKVKAIERLRR